MKYEKFPWGKYKGIALSDLPTNYISYALETFDMPNELKDDLKFILCVRLDIFTTAYTNGLHQEIYRKLSKKYHPDKGGTTESFNAICEFYNLLKEHHE